MPSVNSRPSLLENPKSFPPLKRGMFITFEGIEGSGKTTQCGRLARLLRNLGYQVLETREPGGTPLAEGIRNLLLALPSTRSAPESMTPSCEALLIMAARAQHLAHVIRPALQEGQVVLCDRYFDSTLAYQGYGRGMPLTQLRQLQSLTSDGLSPDLTLLFDLPVAKGLSRRQQARHQNRLDREAKAFHERVRQGFLTLAKRHTRRIKTIQAGKPLSLVARQVDQHIARLFGIR